MYNFISYLFNSENLWSCLRAEWIKVYDLSFVEDEIIAGIEQYIPDASRLISDLEQRAQGVAAALAAKEEARKAGTYGLGKAEKKASTRPQSPNIQKPRPPRIPEPERIDQKVIVKEVPAYLEKTSLSEISETRKIQKEITKKATLEKYDEVTAFKFNETKGGRKIEDVRKEVEQKQMADVDFDKGFFNKPPDFKAAPAKIRLNVAAILREDALYKKQQAKDAQILKSYEEDLRDSSEYYTWLNQMKTRDEEIKLKQVALRREQAKQSNAQAKEATERQKLDNAAVAELMREQADAIKQQRILEEEIRNLEAQQQVQEMMEIREKGPKEARDKVLQAREEQSKKLRDDLELARKQKEEEDAREAEERADKIRELRAINTIQKKNIVVFDPTESSGIGLLDEMSYMEMKERLEVEKRKEEESTALKRQEIIDEKHKKAKELEVRAQNIMRARQVKASANKAQQTKEFEKKAKLEAAQQAAKEAAAINLDDDLDKRREARRRESEALKADADRVRRQQQYLGVAKGHVDDVRAAQQLAGQEREAAALQAKLKLEADMKETANKRDLTNRITSKKKETNSKLAAENQRSKEIIQERKESIEKLKKSVLEKKNMFIKGREQAVTTNTKIVEHNPYAAKISHESLKAVRSNVSR